MEFVVNVIYDGEILVPNKKMVVALPFGSEYSLRLRNKSGKRALANIFIDGEAISDNNEGVIIDAHSYVDVDRFINVKKKLKFVSEKSSAAADFGKTNNNSNGIVKVEWRLEANKPSCALRSHTIIETTYPPWYPCPKWVPYPKPYKPYICPSWTVVCCDDYGQLKNMETISGCTVEGSVSKQDFDYEQFITQTGAPTITIITLKGYSP
jgi:hypothetical protein